MTEKFDSRFDPRYQPGYQDETADLRAKSTASDGTEPRMLISPPPPPTPTREQSAPAAEVTDSEHGIEHNAEFEVEPNPFERTLWIVAAALVVGGVAAAIWANSLNFMGGTVWSWQQMVQSSAWALSGPMATVGLATAVGILFRRAITWKPLE